MIISRARETSSKAPGLLQKRGKEPLRMAPGDAGGRPGKVRLDNPTENTFTAEWDPVPGASAYKLIVREYPKDWATAEVILINDGSCKLSVVEGRFPTSTYQVRLVVVDATGKDSEPSEETTIDTAVGNCAPDTGANRKKCSIQ